MPSKWLRLLKRSSRDEELRGEIESYIEHETAERLAAGASQHEARRDALRKFGNRSLVRETIYEMNSMSVIEGLWKDLVYAVRQLRLNPLFAAAAIASLALGIGANAAIFQLFDAVRLRSLPVAHPEELYAVRIVGEGRSGNFRGRNSQFTNLVWEEIQRRQRTFSGVFAYGDTPLNLNPFGELRNVEGLWVSGSFFPVLGVKPHLGRLLSPSDDRPGCGWPGVVISHAFWQREFGGAEDVLAKTLPIGTRGAAVPILGVTPPEFYGVEVGRRFDVAMPICSYEQANLNNRMFWFLSVMGRLKPETKLETARADLASISGGVFEATVPPYQPRDQAKYVQLRLDLAEGHNGQSGFRGSSEHPLTLLLCMVTAVLLVACANLANMMLARASAREHEFAVRLSIGASRGRVIRQLLVESLLLAAIGAGLGAALAPMLSQWAVHQLSTAREPLYLPLESGWRMLAYTIAAGTITAILFGLAPALSAGRAGARGATERREKFAFRRGLLVGQVALCMTLLTLSFLLARTFRNLVEANPGFEQKGLLVASTFFNASRYPVNRRQAVYEELHSRLEALPEVTGVARSYVIPISGSGWDRAARANPLDAFHEINRTSVSTGYFRVMRTPLIAGRDFNVNDRPESPPVAIVNQAVSRVFFRGENPVGKLLWLDGPEPPFEIVGMAGDSKYSSMREEFTPILYVAASQESEPRLTVRYILRSPGKPEALMTPVKQVLAGADPELNVRFAVLETQIEESLLGEGLMAKLALAFGMLAAGVALLGVYGVTAYIVERRHREFGIRKALGATGDGILRMVLGEVAVLLALGVAAGGVLAMLAARIAASLLYGVEPNDPATMLTALASLTIAGLLAALVPALRASTVAPTEALRQQ